MVLDRGFRVLLFILFWIEGLGFRVFGFLI